MRAFLFTADSESVNDSEKFNGRGHSAVSEVLLWWEMQLLGGAFSSIPGVSNNVSL